MLSHYLAPEFSVSRSVKFILTKNVNPSEYNVVVECEYLLELVEA